MSSNGQVPSSDLVTVQSGIQLSRPTANAWFRMLQAGSSTGHRIGVATPAGGYRSLAVQADMRARPWLYNLSKQSTKKLAPTGQSTHGYGTRVDVVGDLAWAIANGPRFGFFREFGASDPNHFKHDGVTATSGAGARPVRRKDGSMEWRYIQKPGDPSTAILGVSIGELSWTEVNPATDPKEYAYERDMWALGTVSPALIIDPEVWRVTKVQIQKRRAQAGLGGGTGVAVDEASIAEKVLARFRSFWTSGK